MKSQKGKKGKCETADRAADPMDQSLLTDIRDLIFSARCRAAQAVNAELTMFYGEIGRRIRQDILEEKRAVYSKEIVATLSRQLTIDYGAGFSRPFIQLFRNENAWF